MRTSAILIPAGGVLLVLALGLAASGAEAYPTRECVSVIPQDTFEYPRVVGMPTTGSGLTHAILEVTVLDSSGAPIPDAHVQMVFDAACTDLCFCEGAVLEAYTDLQGVARLVMAVGGCCQHPTAAVLKVMGVPVRTYDTATSPDLTSSHGGGDCAVGLADFAALGNALASGAGGCADFTGDNEATLNDFVVFGTIWGDSCPQGVEGP